jgi:uncharacterized protein (TIGR03546 family)
MLLYLIKRLFNLKQAIFGRNQPGQLAWGFALGILLGLVPSSSPIAALILTLVCCLKVNHGMAGVTALVTTLVAAKLDPYSHAVGMKLLEHPQLIGAWAFVWQLPGVPWMSINNTVVLGSLVLGLVSVGPTYFVSYPIFRRLAPKERPIVTQPEGVATSQQADETIAPLPANDVAAANDVAVKGDTAPNTAAVKVAEVTHAESVMAANASAPAVTTAAMKTESVVESGPILLPIGDAKTGNDSAGQARNRDAAKMKSKSIVKFPAGSRVDTRIEVVRMRPDVSADRVATGSRGEVGPRMPLDGANDAASRRDQLTDPEVSAAGPAAGPAEVPPKPMTESLNYLLGQLRDTRDGRVA